MERLRHAYGKAPFYKENKSFVEELYDTKPALLADFTIASTMQISKALGIGTRYLRSSELKVSGTKTDRLIGVLTKVGATHYISGPSARAYIEESEFAKAGISLEYMTYDYAPYEQLYPPYEAGVSILDLLFMKGAEARSYFA
jgi:hypothetical protein